MFKRILSVIIILFFSPVICFSEEANPIPVKKIDKEALRVTLSGETIYLDRSNKFKIANTGNQGNRVNGINGNELPLKYDIDSWGGGYGVEAVFPNAGGINIEFLFNQFFC